jgi:7-cyano-7-deazaguanine tRNA-ribosyltransferase
MSEIKFELTARDGLARIAKLKTPHGLLNTPTLLPVINPNEQLITAKDMKKIFGAQGMITNSYIIYKSQELRDNAVKNGVHRIIDFDGPVMTDSGTFQLYTYGKVSVTPQDIIEFQKTIKPDIGTILDVFGPTDLTYDEAKADVDETLSRAGKAVEIKGDLSLAGTIQGGVYPELREHCAAEMSKLDFDLHPIGGVVPFMEEYQFKELVRIIIACKKGLIPSRPVHLFGAGHPMIFPLAVALGCDTFDSASYMKYANDDRLLFSTGTRKLDQLEELPCTCPVCIDTNITELRGLEAEGRKVQIAKHNLYICFNELKLIKQSIREGTMLELMEQRARAHPHLLQSIPEIYKNYEYLEQFEPISRRRFKYVGPESMNRPEIKRFQNRVKKNYTRPPAQTEVCLPESSDRTESLELHYREAIENIQNITDAHFVFQSAFGPVPVEFDSVYPFGQAVLEPGLAEELSKSKKVMAKMEEYSHNLKSEFSIIWTGEETIENLKMLTTTPNKQNLDESRVKAIADYQFGTGATDALFTGELKFVKSKNTGKIRNIISDGEHVLSLRAGDGLFTMKSSGAARLHAAFKAPRLRVIVNDDSAEFNREGKNVFSKFVLKSDPALRPGDEVLITDEKDTLVALGRMILTGSEIEAFSTGIAVRVREGIR